MGDNQTRNHRSSGIGKPFRCCPCHASSRLADGNNRSLLSQGCAPFESPPGGSEWLGCGDTGQKPFQHFMAGLGFGRIGQ
jgi:hypothetical protein